MSNVFILLLLCPNILLYLLVVTVISLVSPCYYPYMFQSILYSQYLTFNTIFGNSYDCPYSTYIYTNLPLNHTLNISVINALVSPSLCYVLFSYIMYLNSLVLSVWGLVLSLVCCIYYIRDVIREYTSTYLSCIILIVIAMLGILISESILFASYFVSHLSSTCSYIYTLEAIYTSDPTYVTYCNCIVLTNVGISMSCNLIIRDLYRLHIVFPLYVWVILLTFLHIQIKELLCLVLYISESTYVGMFFSLLGLHLFHILIGILLLTHNSWTSCYNRSVLSFNNLILIVSPYHTSYTLQLVYWHFVDLLWIIIYYLLYH